jgi:hypothetical protein
MVSNTSFSFEQTPIHELSKLLQIPDSGRALLPVLSVVKGLLTQHPRLVSEIKVTEDILGKFMSELQQATSDQEDLLRLTKQSGVCTERPVYALLVEAALSLSNLPSGAWSMVAVALEFVLIRRIQFAEHPNRLVEFSKALRQLMVVRQPIMLLGWATFESYAQLASAMGELSANPQASTTDRRYAKYIETTLSTEWKQVVRSPGLRRKAAGGTRRKRPAGETTVATDDSDVAMIGLPATTMLDDVLNIPEQSDPCMLLEVRPTGTWAKNRPSLDVIEDRGICRVHRINTTNRLIQANNKSLLSVSILQPDELSVLLNALLRRNAESVVELNCRLATLLLLWTGINLKTLCHWQLAGEGAGLVQHGKHWYTQCIVEPVLIHDARQKIILSCPTVFGIYASALAAQRNNNQLLTFLHAEDATQQVSNWLARLSQRHGLTISIDRVESFLANRLQCTPELDPIYQRLAFGVERFQFRVQRHYTQMTAEHIGRGISEIWQRVHQELAQPDSLAADFYQVHPHDPEIVYGSERAGALSQHCSLVKALRDSCQQFSRQQIDRSLPALFAYHNRYVEWTALMLLSGTGCRAVRNPFPSLALIFDSLLFVCDKDDISVATRLVSLCPVVERQISFYRDHLNAMASRIAAIAPDIAAHNRQMLTYEQSDLQFITRLIKMKNAVGPLFYLDGMGRAQQLAPAQLTKLTRPFGLEVNFGRHHLRSSLIKQRVHNELVNQILGHWSIGESPFSQFSQLSPYESNRVLRPVLTAVMEEQGWKAQRSLLT